MTDRDNRLTGNPAIMILMLGTGVAALIAVTIALTQDPAGAAVGVGPDTELADIETGDAPADEMSTEADVDALQAEGDAAIDNEASQGFDGRSDRVDVVTAEPDAADGDAADAAPDSDLPLGLVDDPDNGAKSGPDPDGGAGSFNPTPSGPEGRDGDPLTTE